MALNSEGTRRRVGDDWLNLRSTAVHRINALKALRAVDWPAYRDNTAGLSATDKAEVNAAIQKLKDLCGALAAQPGATGAAAELAALANITLPERSRTLKHTRFLVGAQEQIDTFVQQVRLTRTDIESLVSSRISGQPGFTADDATEANGSVTAINAALSALSTDNTAAFDTAIAQLVVI